MKESDRNRGVTEGHQQLDIQNQMCANDLISSIFSWLLCSQLFQGYTTRRCGRETRGKEGCTST